MSQLPTHSWRNAMLATLITAVVLAAMGQPLWCQCGTFSVSSWDIWTSHNSQHLIDPYTFTHVLHGFVLCWCLVFLPPRFSPQQRFLLAALLECAWEIMENSPFVINRYRMATISLDYLGDSVLNSVADVIACMLGYEFASRVRSVWSIAAFFLIELILMIAIRDGLILNVLMLLTPIDAIRDWQLEIRQ